MNKNTLTFERKLYVAPACKTHVLQVEEGILVVSTQQNTIERATIDEWEEEL